MKRSKRLASVLRIADQRLREAEQKFGRAQQKLQQERQQLAQLETYLAEYQQQMRETRSASVAELQRMQAFIARLQQALDQQRTQVVVAELNVQHAMQIWQAARGKQRAIGSLQEQAAAAEAQAEEKKLQALIDEMQNARRGRS